MQNVYGSALYMFVTYLFKFWNLETDLFYIDSLCVQVFYNT